MNINGIVLKEELPKEEGYYWWTNFGEHTPTVLRVRLDYASGKLYADNEEYGFFIIPKEPIQLELSLEDEDEEVYDDRELWGRIPNPIIDGEEIKPDSY